MLQPGPAQPLGTAPAPVTRSEPAPGDQQPIRFLLIRQKPGDLPWLVGAMTHYMAPAQVISVIGMGNALWRLGHERFDAVLLDVEGADRALVERCREQIADIAAVPVLDLHDRPAAPAAPAPEFRSRRRRQAMSAPSMDHQVARLPWERRAKREARKAERETSFA
jgi:hypothetical protein